MSIRRQKDIQKIFAMLAAKSTEGNCLNTKQSSTKAGNAKIVDTMNAKKQWNSIILIRVKKSFSISGKYNLSWEKLKEELDKCILLCSNCHKKRHANDHISLEDYQKWIVPQSVRTEKAKERKEKHEQQAEAVAQKYSVNKDVFEKIRLGGRKVIRPSKDDFFKEYEEVDHNKSEMGRRYGVSSNAIRKWIESYKKYGI